MRDKNTAMPNWWTDRAWNTIIFATLAAILLVLWWVSGGQFIVKGLTENYNILLAAANVHDWRTFLVQDVAATSDPAGHPYWYIHHPNLFAKTLSLIELRLGFGLETQVLVQLGLSIAGLAFAVSSFARFSKAAVLGALFIAVTSYGSFYFSAGDLARGPTLLIACLLVAVLLRNRQLSNIWYTLATAALSVAAIMSDWGLTVFVIAFAFCWATFECGRVPWRWVIVTVALPAIIAFAIYEAAVINTVGWEFFLYDARVTYLGRLGTGSSLDYRNAIETFRNHNVIIWPPQGLGRDTLVQFVAAVIIMPLLNTGPVWVLLMPVALAALVHIVRKMRLSRIMWAVIGVGVLLSLFRLAPMAVIAIVVFLAALHLGRANSRSATTELCGLVSCVILALSAAAGAFPAFIIGFIMASGRSPFPLLEMGAAALFLHTAAMGVGARLIHRPARPFSIATLDRSDWLLAGFVAVTLVAVLTAGDSFFGVPKILAIGLALAVGGGSLVLQNVIRDYVHPNRSDAPWRRWVARWRVSAAMMTVTLVLAYHRSASPTVLGHYSPGYAALLSLVALATLAAIVLALFPKLASALLRKAHDATGGIASGGATDMRSRRAIAFVTAFFAIGQAAWLAVSVAASPPSRLVYAKALQDDRYRGKIFVTSSFEGMTWYYTHGPAYMAPTNPPPPGPISPRFRHFADWKARKYDRPDYYLCDNTGLAFIRPGTSIEGAETPPTTCTQCTCRDSSAALQAQGHSVIVDRPDFSIVKFNWKAADR